jgi:hypothetical protein
MSTAHVSERERERQDVITVTQTCISTRQHIRTTRLGKPGVRCVLVLNPQQAP